VARAVPAPLPVHRSTRSVTGGRRPPTFNEE
jgi:hypothetical protein